MMSSGPWPETEINTTSGDEANCMAGLGEACSHVAAVLFHIEATVRLHGSATICPSLH